MKSMMGENRIFVGHVVRVYGAWLEEVHDDNWRLTLSLI